MIVTSAQVGTRRLAKSIQCNGSLSTTSTEERLGWLSSSPSIHRPRCLGEGGDSSSTSPYGLEIASIVPYNDPCHSSRHLLIISHVFEGSSIHIQRGNETKSASAQAANTFPAISCSSIDWIDRDPNTNLCPDCAICISSPSQHQRPS